MNLKTIDYEQFKNWSMEQGIEVTKVNDLSRKLLKYRIIETLRNCCSEFSNNLSRRLKKQAYIGNIVVQTKFFSSKCFSLMKEHGFVLAKFKAYRGESCLFIESALMPKLAELLASSHRDSLGKILDKEIRNKELALLFGFLCAESLAKHKVLQRHSISLTAIKDKSVPLKSKEQIAKCFKKLKEQYENNKIAILEVTISLEGEFYSAFIVLPPEIVHRIGQSSRYLKPTYFKIKKREKFFGRWFAYGKLAMISTFNLQ